MMNTCSFQSSTNSAETVLPVERLWTLESPYDAFKEQATLLDHADQEAQCARLSVFLRYDGSIFDKINGRGGKKKESPFFLYEKSLCFSTGSDPVRFLFCLD